MHTNQPSSSALFDMTQAWCVGALLLAAGSSRRFGDADKRCASLNGGATVLQVCIDNLASVVEDVAVVLRHEDADLIQSLDFKAGKVVSVSGSGAGMGVSLAAGIGAMSYCDSILVFLGDMPYKQRKTIQQILTLSRSNPIVVPTFDGTWGHPVGFPKHFSASNLSRDRS